MTPVYYKGAEDIIKIHSFYILFIFSFIISIFISNCQAFAVEGIWRDYNNLKELVKDIRNGDKDDDKMNYDKFKDSNVYKSANEDFKKCVDLANKVGEKLGDYEIVRCFENANFFKEKYVDDNNQKVGIQLEQQNVTNQNQNGSEQPVQQEEVQLAENKTELQSQEQEQGHQQEPQNVTNQNQNGSEQPVQQEEVQLAENKTELQSQEQEQGHQQEPQNVTNQNQSSNESKIETESKVSSNDGCDPSYPDICITTYSEKLSCADIPFRNFKVLPPDSRGFDSDSDGLGCEG
jgi:hypothetical protein